MRVDKATLLHIFKQIDLDNDGTIVYQEYTKAIKENPDLLDWFQLLNKQTHEATTPSPADVPVRQDSGHTENPFEMAASLMIDKEKVKKIIQMKNEKQEKEKEVNQLKQEVAQIKKDTEDQLSGLMKQIAVMTETVQSEVARKQQEKKDWEESQA